MSVRLMIVSLLTAIAVGKYGYNCLNILFSLFLFKYFVGLQCFLEESRKIKLFTFF